MPLITIRRVFVIITVILIVSVSFSVFAEDPDSKAVAPTAQESSGQPIIRIGTLYGGLITNEYKDSSKGISMRDSGFMTGMYCQWIQPDLFQGNFFGYWAPDVNYSRVIGFHANVDSYFYKAGRVTFVAGVDVENIHISMDAGSHVKGLSNFEMENNVLFCLARTGLKVAVAQSDAFSASIFPYIGATYQKVSGDVTVNPNGPPMMTPETTTSFSDSETYFSWGVNANASIYRYLMLSAKYLGRAEKDNYMNSYTFQANVSLSRSVVLSYQCKYMELSNGYDLFNILGISVIF